MIKNKDPIKKIDIDGLDFKIFKSGIKKNNTDLLLVTFPKLSSISGVFTKSKTPSAAVIDCIKKINFKNRSIRCLVVNSGNANAFTGMKGTKTVNKITKFLSNLYNCDENEVFSSSTGVIGEELNPSKITSCIKNKKPVFVNSIEEAAKSIMTTDTFPKYAISKVKYKNFEVNVIGIAKGSGMIAPNMGTMLAYIFTDLNVSSKVLQKILTNENDKTFNSITVDSDTSTSDTCLLISTNQLKNKKINNFHDKFLNNFKKCISNIMLDLAKQIVIDGEGAKKIIEVRVENAKSISSAKNIAFSIANSPLVKTAIAGEDANWGRIIMAIGKSYEPIDQNKIKIKFGKYLVTKNGMRYSKYSEKDLSEYLKNKEISISIDIGMGNHKWTVYTCDLTEQYIRINADYRS